MVHVMRIAIFLNTSLIVLASATSSLSQELEIVKLDEVRVSQSRQAKLALHPDGNLIAVFGVGNSVRLVDRQSQTTVKTLVGHRKTVRSAQFSKDGRTLASGGVDKQVVLWSVPDGLLKMKLDKHRGGISSLTFDPTGKTLASGSTDKKILLWDVLSGDKLATLKGHAATVAGLSFDPTSAHLFSGSEDGTLIQWSAATRKQLKKVQTQGNPIVQLLLTPDNKHLVAVDNRGELRIWDLAKGILVRTISTSATALSGVAIAPDQPWVYMANRSAIHVWSIDTGRLLDSISVSHTVLGLNVVPRNGQLAVLTADGFLQFWNVSVRPPDVTAPRITIEQPPSDARFYDDKVIVSGVVSDDRDVQSLLVNEQSAQLRDAPTDQPGVSRSFSVTVPLVNVGANVLVVRAMDGKGNTSERRLTFYRLTKDQALEILSPPNNLETDLASVDLQVKLLLDWNYWTAELNAVELFRVERPLPPRDTATVITESLPLVSGFNQLRVTAVSRSGEKISKILHLRRQVSGFTPSIVSGSEKPRVGPQRWAVIIGVSRYENPGIPNLMYPDDDAQSYYEFLKTKQGGAFEENHIRLLLNEQATLENVRSALFEFLRQAIDTDFITIFFSGHGTPEPGNPNNMYLLTYDSDPRKLATTAFPMWDVNTALSRYIAAKKVVIFTDACHSGGILATGVAEKGFIGGESNLINRYLADLANAKDGIVVFTASQPGEVSQEREDLGHGVFTYYLLEGLRGKADLNNDYTVTVGELMDFVEDQVKRATNGNQRPLRSATVFDHDLPMSVLPH